MNSTSCGVSPAAVVPLPGSGIVEFAALNVDLEKIHHLNLADIVETITGAPVRERIPDEVIDTADEYVEGESERVIGRLTWGRVLASGAAGVRMGTRFIAAAESNAHPDYVRAIISAQAEDSVRTNRFEVECPLCPSTHGVLRSALDAAEAFDGSFVAELNGEPVAKFRGTPPFKGFTGNIGAMACYAGQSVGEVRGVQPAAEIVAELAEQAERLLKGTATAPV